MSKITLEDINTWLLKYGELDAPKYSMPHIDVIGALYRGNSTRVSDVINLPTNEIEYVVYYQGKPVTEISLSMDFADDELQVRVVTKSYDPYVNADVMIRIPVQTKHLTSLEDLNNYSYGYVDELSDVVGSIDSDIVISLSDDAIINNCNLTINANVTLNGDLIISNSNIMNNSRLTFESVSFHITDESKDYIIINNENLTIKDSNVETHSPFLLNKGGMSLLNTNINPFCVDVPFIYSNNTNINLIGNNIIYSNEATYKDFGICFIRCNDEFDIDKLILDNNFSYEDIPATIDEINYLINGEGVCYAIIDNDEIYVRSLEVTEDV